MPASDNLEEHYWSRFSSAMGTAQFLLQDVDGLVGKHMTQMANSLVIMTQGIYENWRESWEENPNKKVIQQQVDLLVASKELQKAYKQFLDLLQYRKFEHRKELDVQMKLCRPSTSFGWTRAGGKRTFKLTVPDHADAMPGSSKSPPPNSTSPSSKRSKPADSPEDYDPSQTPVDHNESPSPEAREIKQEPIDEEDYSFLDEHPGIKAEPIEPTDPDANVKMEDYSMEDYERMDVKQEEPEADIFNPETSESRRPPIHLLSSGSPPAARPPINPAPGLMSGSGTAVVASKGPLTIDRNAFVPLDSRHQFRNQFAYDPLKEKYAGWKEPRMCYLCDKYTDDYYGTPTNDMNRADFLRRIMTLTPNAIARVASLKKNDRRAFFCVKHVAVREFAPTTLPEHALTDDDETEEERALREKFTIPMRFKPSLNRETIAEKNILPPPRAALTPMRKCDLCAGRAWPFCLSPKDQSLAPAFFANLVGLNKKQQERAQCFIEQERRATICKSHMNVGPSVATEPRFVQRLAGQVDAELQRMKNQMDRMRDGPMKNSILHAYIKKKKQKDALEQQRVANGGYTDMQAPKNTQPISIPSRYDARKGTAALMQGRTLRRVEVELPPEVTEIESPRMVVVNNSRRKSTYKTVPEECYTIHNLKTLIDAAPSLEDDAGALSGDLVKEE